LRKSLQQVLILPMISAGSLNRGGVGTPGSPIPIS
jgi:hypothetical protein